jgi:hypothetical protein
MLSSRRINKHPWQVKNNKQIQKGRFGSFSGVFTPNALIILGLILFFRTSWAFGHDGLIGSLTIIAIANTMPFLTGLSIVQNKNTADFVINRI